jgi:hypothetical protein
LLGAAFKEQDLLSLGYAIEQTLNLRRQPFSTPALVADKRPPARTATAAFSGAALNLSYTETMSRLQYMLNVAPAAADRLLAVWIHVGTPEKPSAAHHQLFGSGQPPTGAVTLGAADRKAIAEGRLLVERRLRNERS